MSNYRTRDGDTVDIVAFKYYGVRAGAVEAVLNANPGLAAHGAILPAGVVIVLPPLAAPSMPSVRLWGDV